MDTNFMSFTRIREKSYRSDKTDKECRLLGAFLHVFQDEKGHELNERGLSSHRFLALTTALDIFRACRKLYIKTFVINNRL